MQPIEERILRLERQNRRLRVAMAGMVGVLLFACAVGLVAPTSAPAGGNGVLTVRGLVVEDDQGRTRAMLTENGLILDAIQGKTSSYLTPNGVLLHDLAGEVRAALTIDTEQRPNLRMFADGKVARVVFRLDPDGPVLGFLDKKQRPVLNLFDSKDMAGLWVKDSDNEMRAALTAEKDRSGLLLVGPDGKAAVTLVAAAKATMMHLGDDKRKDRVWIQAAGEDTAVTVFDQEGKVAGQLP